MFGGGRVTSASANQMFEPKFEVFTDEQLVCLLDPVGYPVEYKFASETETATSITQAFYHANNGIDNKTADTEIQKHRNQIQDRIIAASNERCNLYTTYIKRVDEYQNGILGTLTTALGGAGAIVTDATTARVFSGLSAITNGTKAELDKATFESLATSVIIPGIEKSRSEIYNDILNKRKNTIADYTIERAIADAIRYHGACSMAAGISYAQQSIQSSKGTTPPAGDKAPQAGDKAPQAGSTTHQ